MLIESIDQPGKERGQMQTAVNKAIRVGRASALAIGVGVVLALVLGVATVALAAVPGDPFKLGKVNIISNATTALQGTAPNGGAMLHLRRDSGIGPVLKVENTGGGFATRGIDITVPAGQSPINVSEGAGRAANLNADELDGKDFTALFSGKTYQNRSDQPGPGGDSFVLVETSCDPGDVALGGGATAGDFGVTMISSIPANANTWATAFKDNGGPSGFVGLVQCADFPPLR
jgi:hypothetical protein